MRVKYKDHNLGHQQFWTLVRKLTEDDYVVEVTCYERAVNVVIREQGKTKTQAVESSPFLALKRCVESLETKQ